MKNKDHITKFDISFDIFFEFLYIAIIIFKVLIMFNFHVVTGLVRSLEKSLISLYFVIICSEIKKKKERKKLERI